MNRAILFLIGLLFLATPQTQAQQFPQDWQGIWKGSLKVFQASKKVQEIDMELHIQPIDTSDNWTWTIVYKTEKEDYRGYELIAIDTASGHYQIDEKNSILLDGYIVENTFLSRFSVNSSLLQANYTLEEDHIRMEFITGNTDQKILTGKELKEESIESVYSYPLPSYHRAILRKE